MEKKHLGPYSQRGYNQMGDGHGRGAASVKSEGSFAKTQDETWKDHVLRDKGNGRPKSPVNKQQEVNKEIWKERLITSKVAVKKSEKPKLQIRQAAKAKPVITKLR